MQTIWVLGATGKGGRAIASELIGGDADVVLIGRDHDRLAASAASLGGQNRTILSPGPAELVADVAQSLECLLGLPAPGAPARQRALVVPRVIADEGGVD